MLPIRFINLDRAGERREVLEARASTLGLTLERSRAVEAGEVPAGEMRRLSGSWERDLSAAEVACFLSHRGQWERVASEGRPALILEDDAVLSRRLPEVLPAIAALEGIDLLNLEDFGKARFLARGRGLEMARGVRGVRCLRDKAGAAAYVLWPSGAKRLLRNVEGRAAPADAALHGAGLQAFVAEPALALQAFVLDGLVGAGGPPAASFIQPAAGEPRKARARTPAQVLRRAATQAALLPLHARRMTDVVYRRVETDPSDFR